MTVTRFAQLGILVKSMLVPEVEATAVPAVMTLEAIVLITAPVIVGEVPSTTAPVPVLVVTPLPPLATGNGWARVTTCPVEIVTAVVVPFVWRTSCPDVSPEMAIAVPDVVPAEIAELMRYSL